MRYSLSLPVSRVERGDEFISAQGIREMAAAAEEAGFDACSVSEHPLPPTAWLESGGHHTLDPLVALSLVAAATQRIHLHTGVWVLPYRNPFMGASALASLDAASGGRVIAGVGAGYLEAEFRALGADFVNRNEVSDTAIVEMKRAWSGEAIVIEGENHRLRPLPTSRPHPPLWVGGNSRRAIRRAVDHGDGWMPFPNAASVSTRTRTPKLETLDDLAERIDYLREYSEEVGRRQPLDICFVPFGRRSDSKEGFEVESFQKQVAELEVMGVTWLLISLPGEDRRAFCDWIRFFCDQIIRPLG
ncbi:MAG: TIGR03619 family F420-dependent LLM class oxidoreductase [Myxococcota bacterium]|nr:TIGR03619 family F420-dependent LLM class oxidoreductase [Myxococcota bacterium]